VALSIITVAAGELLDSPRLQVIIRGKLLKGTETGEGISHCHYLI